MNRFARLRVRLLALVLTAMVPGFVLAIVKNREDRRRETAQVYASAQELAGLVALQERQLVDTAHLVLVAIAHLPIVASADTAACSSGLQHLLSHYQRFANFGVADSDGNIVCSAVPMSHPVNIADREYFRGALKRRDFAVGVFQTGRIADRVTINFGYPLDVHGRDSIRGVVWAAVDL